ncbi:hypothetical protein RHMOL_Rhmol09G0091900 [Rhododendron molle]|uniref:Uncharacterized protein n=1 Tax=Rhododendron molle TaxID=49168 RepID=A0ACC0MDC8_RHOML|nr:hypothetical protein RHMOL_Rhmol09G0091900 [Rhododendron molle]
MCWTLYLLEGRRRATTAAIDDVQSVNIIDDILSSRIPNPMLRTRVLKLFVLHEEMQVERVEQMREMEKSLILFCKYNGLCAGVRLSRSSRIGDLMKILCGKFITIVDSHGFDSGTSGCGGDVGANSSGVFDSGSGVGGNTSKGISFSGQGLVGRRLESMGDVDKEDDLGAMFCPHQQRPRLFDAWKELIKSVGQLFVGGSEGFRDALRKYSIVHSFEFDFVKNETERVTAICNVKSCKWNVHARLDKVSGCFYIKRDYSDSFNQLQWYRNVVLNSDARNVFDVEWDETTNRFLRLFVAFDACVQGFKHCRHVLSVDATFLKASHMGCLMSASAKDGLFPLCFGVVDSENNDNWLWFMEKLHGILDEERRIVVFISDHHRGIKEGNAKVFPSSFHAYCLYHLKGNLRTALMSTNVKYKESLIRVFSKCAYALTVAKFNQHIGNLLKHVGAIVVHFLSELPNERWANVFFPGQRYGAMSSSLAECFKSWILKKRELPMVDMVDRVRKKMMKSMCLRRERASDVADCGTSILPPLSKRPLGRPKKKSIRSNGEKVREMKCGRCEKMRNHNKLTCKEDLRPGF